MSSTFSDLSDRDEVENRAEAVEGTSSTSATFSDLSDREVEIIAEALKGTTWLALFSRASTTCRAAAIRVAKDEAPLRRLKVSDVVCNVELVKWAIDQGCPRDKGRRICACAASEGHLETLKCLRASGFEWDWGTCASAARGGHLDVLQWARANGCEWDWRTTSSAAEAGQLEVLKWARANGCPWNEDTCSLAARGGHLDVLKWARANGCEWDERHVFPCSQGRPPGRPPVGKGQRIALGTSTRVPGQPEEATWTSSSGQGPKDALGIITRVLRQPEEATWTSSSGQGPTAANGTRTRVLRQPGEATWTS